MPCPAPPRPGRLPDRLLILSVFVVASCGLAYELIAGALSSYLLGDSVLQFSSIIGCYLFAMGVGSHLSKYVDDRDVLARFIDIELLVGLLGGLSATLLFLLFAWMSAPFRSALYALVFVLGVLVGMEIPLVMRVLNARQASFSELVSRVLTFDYLGAGGVAAVPAGAGAQAGAVAHRLPVRHGQRGGGAVDAVALPRRDPRPAARLLRGVLVMAFLAAGLAGSDRLTRWAERACSATR
jgi:spermidine synthase